MSHTLILGIGNSLLSDEGAGVHALSYLRKYRPDLPFVEYLDGGTLSFTLAGAIEDATNVIVIDAARLDLQPGGVRCLLGEDMDKFVISGKCSVHEVGLADLMDICRLTGGCPANRALIGVQPESFGWGEGLSDSVAAAMPEIADHVEKLISQWHPPSGESDSIDLPLYVI